MDAVRIDKWLWAARMYKHRTQATRACSGGHVKLNGKTVKASRSVKVGDQVEAVTADSRRRILEVLALSDKRGPAPVAQALYADHSPPPPPRSGWDRIIRERGAGRPTKRDRRRLNRLRRSYDPGGSEP